MLPFTPEQSIATSPNRSAGHPEPSGISSSHAQDWPLLFNGAVAIPTILSYWAESGHN
jgi:hypothetical protein